ncbi:MAG: hypothetical protein EOP35_01730 [Rubrivivax sp.]|nr:MAG: hypothetical protein EOP35_01730 [Rubrivivax sp.]
MATDARFSTTLASNPKVKKLRNRLGADGCWAWVCLVLWVASDRSDGDLAGMDDEDIELSADWRGEPGAFVKQLVSLRMLDGEESERSVHDWAEHNPWAAGAVARSEKSRWAGLCKQHGRAEAARQMPEYAKRLAEAGHKQPPSEPEPAIGQPAAVPDSASGTPLAETGSAPLLSLPFPSSPLPSPPSPAPTPIPVAPQPPPAPRTRKPAAAAKEPAPSTAAWNAYADAYELRYRSEPVRNAMVNGQMAQVVARLGAQEAPHVATFFVGHNLQMYVRDMHPVGLLLRDAEKLRTEWATNRQMTATKALQTDKTATNFGAFQDLIAEAEAMERNHAQQ